MKCECDDLILNKFNGVNDNFQGHKAIMISFNIQYINNYATVTPGVGTMIYLSLDLP